MGRQAATANRDAVHAQSRAVAVWMEAFASPSYGPGGGHKAVDASDGPLLLRSAASALREIALPDPAPRMYQELAATVQANAGDQATAAVLLTARLVRHALDGAAPIPAYLDGYALARRQALAVLESLAVPASAPAALATVAPGLGGPAIEIITAGLAGLASNAGAIDLDLVDIRTESGAEPEWSDALVAKPQHAPRQTACQDGSVLLLTQGWHPKPRMEGITRRITGPDTLAQAHAEEEALRRGFLARLDALGVRLLVCQQDLDPHTVQRAVSAGTWVWTDAPEDAVQRIATATGATSVPRIEDATAGEVGRADLQRRPRRRGGLALIGPGPAGTLVLPAATGPYAAAVREDGERLLRAAGAYLAEPRAVPGGGRWQRDVAASLRRAADAAPGKTPFAIHAAADAFAALADDLVRNTGADAMEVPLLADAGKRLDLYPAVRLGVQTAFSSAVQTLRLDGRHDKVPSDPAALRGGTGPIGSPRGMPGDVPPLM